jgi:hypothetical protein
MSFFFFSIFSETIKKDVQPNSPAALAGLRSNSDYIIGSDSHLTEVNN